MVKEFEFIYMKNRYRQNVKGFEFIYMKSRYRQNEKEFNMVCRLSSVVLLIWSVVCFTFNMVCRLLCY